MPGSREPSVYGTATLADIDAELTADGADMGLIVTEFPSNHEGALVDRIQAAAGAVDVRIINPGAYSPPQRRHPGRPAAGCGVIEVHISNLY